MSGRDRRPPNSPRHPRPGPPSPQHPRAPKPANAEKRGARPVPDIDALLRHANDPSVDLLAEAEAEIAADLAASGVLPVGDLTDVASLRRLLRRHGLRPNKSFGQNFLVSRDVLDAIVTAAELSADDNILEVGSGTGVLTVELARRARRIVAVELDRNILPVLRETTTGFDNVEIIPRDLLDVQPDVIFGQEPYKLVANLPYYITALTLRHFLEAANPPRLLVVMVQWEVAQRLAARPGDMSLLGLSVQFYGTPRILMKVPAASFFPPPQVDSAVVRVDLFPQPPLTPDARDLFFRLAHAGFAEKRKQLHNSLARNLHVSREAVAAWLAEANIDSMRRAETLSLDEWITLTTIVQRQSPVLQTYSAADAEDLSDTAETASAEEE